MTRITSACSRTPPISRPWLRGAHAANAPLALIGHRKLQLPDFSGVPIPLPSARRLEEIFFHRSRSHDDEHAPPERCFTPRPWRNVLAFPLTRTVHAPAPGHCQSCPRQDPSGSSENILNLAGAVPFPTTGTFESFHQPSDLLCPTGLNDRETVGVCFYEGLQVLVHLLKDPRGTSHVRRPLDRQSSRAGVVSSRSPEYALWLEKDPARSAHKSDGGPANGGGALDLVAALFPPARCPPIPFLGGGAGALSTKRVLGGDFEGHFHPRKASCPY